MPYVTPARREALDKFGFEAVREPGDMTYLAFIDFLSRWQESPRWATYHAFAHDVETIAARFSSRIAAFGEADVRVAVQLALNEFFWRYVRPYEDQKMIENGDIKTAQEAVNGRKKE